MMACLHVLHMYWFYMMLCILFCFAKKGKADDTINNVNYIPQ